MKDKYWALILIAVIVVSLAGIILMHPKQPDQIITVCLPCEVCPTCEDCGDRIDYCFEKCKYGIMIVGGPDLQRTCLWNCLHPDYNIVKIN